MACTRRVFVPEEEGKDSGILCVDNEKGFAPHHAGMESIPAPDGPRQPLREDNPAVQSFSPVAEGLISDLRHLAARQYGDLSTLITELPRDGGPGPSDVFEGYAKVKTIAESVSLQARIAGLLAAVTIGNNVLPQVRSGT